MYMYEIIKKKLHIIHNIYIKHKFFLSKKSYSMDGEDLIIFDYFKNKKKVFLLMLAAITQYIEIILFYYIKKVGKA